MMSYKKLIQLVGIIFIVVIAICPITAFAVNSVPYTNTFEITAGTELVDTNEWYSSDGAGATVVGEVYAYTNFLRPMHYTSHSNVVDFSSAGVTNILSTTVADTNMFVSFMIKAAHLGSAPNPNNAPVKILGTNGAVEAAMYVSTSGLVSVYHGLYEYDPSDNPSNWVNQWTELSHEPIANGDWARIDFEMMFAIEPFGPPNAWGETYFSIKVNGITQTSPSAYDDNPDVAGEGPTVYAAILGTKRVMGGKYFLCADSCSYGDQYPSLTWSTTSPTYLMEAFGIGAAVRIDDLVIRDADIPDTQAPVQVSVDIDTNTHTIVTVHYDEVLKINTAPLDANVYVESNGGGYNTIASVGGTVVIVDTNLVITFDNPLTAETNTIQVAGNTLKDWWGNMNGSPATSAEFDSSEDIIIPSYVTVALNPTKDVVTLQFDEPVTNMIGTNITNSILLRTWTGEAYSALDANDTVEFNSSNLVITFDTPLSTADNKIKILGGSVKDLTLTRHNQILADIITADSAINASLETNAPAYVSATIETNATDTIITMFFDELIYNAGVTLLNETTIQTNGSTWSALTGGDTVTISGNKVIITLTGIILNRTDNMASLTADALEDASGNVKDTVTTTAALDPAAGDGAPSFIFGEVDTNDHTTVTIHFDQDIFDNTGGSLKAGVTIATDGVTPVALAAGDTVNIVDGNTLVIVFASALTTPDNVITIAGNTLKDGSDNPLVGDTVTVAGELDASEDLFPPVFVSNGLDATRKIWTISFNENLYDLTGGDIHGNMQIAFNSDDFVALTGLGTAAITSSSDITVTLNSQLTTISNVIRIAAGTVRDAASNQNIQFDTADLDGRDLIAPAYQNSVTLDSTHKIITLQYDENLYDESGDLDNNVQISTNGVDFANIGSDGTVSLVDDKLVVTMLAALAEPANIIRVTASTIKDVWGNVQGGQVDTASFNASALTTNTIPYAESFEAYPQDITMIGRGGWNGDVATNARIVARSSSYGGTFPMDSSTHLKVMEVYGTGTSNQFDNTDGNTKMYLDFMLEPVRTAEQPHPALVTGSQMSMFIDTNGYIALWHGIYDDPGTFSSATPGWTTLSHTPIGETNWTRVTMIFDYLTDATRSDKFFSIAINGGDPLTNLLAWQEIPAATSNGTWFLTATSGGGAGSAQFNAFHAMGPMALDDITLSKSPSGYTVMGTPYSWLDLYYAVGDYEAWDTSDTDNDGLTAWEEYIAGTDPTDPASTFQIVKIELMDGSNYLTWLGSSNGATSPFAIYRNDTNPTNDWNFVINVNRSADGTNVWGESAPATKPTYYKVTATNPPVAP